MKKLVWIVLLLGFFSGKAQIFDGQAGEEDIVRKKILDMIKRHQQKNKL